MVVLIKRELLVWEFQVFLKIDFHKAKSENKYKFESTFACNTR